jgi:hypothetical protein
LISGQPQNQTDLSVKDPAQPLAFAMRGAQWLFGAGLVVGIFSTCFALEFVSTSRLASSQKRLEQMTAPLKTTPVRTLAEQTDFVGWWIYSIAEQGWWKVPQLSNELAEIFWPGYPPFWRQDSLLIKKLQSLPFDFSLRLSPSSDAYFLTASFAGCLSVLESQGADSLLLGNCEGYRSLHPISFSAPGKKRILPCFRNEDNFPFTRQVVQTLEKLPQKKRPREIIWSFSIWQLTQAPLEELPHELPHRHPLSAFQTHWHHWGELLSPATHLGTRVFTESERRISSFLQWDRVLGSIAEPPACYSSQSTKRFEELKSLLTTFQRLGARVTLTLAPHLLPLLNRESACDRYWRGKLLGLEHKPNLQVVSVAADTFLTWQDFLYPVGKGDEYLLLPFHLNASGATKYTQQVTARLQQ